MHVSDLSSVNYLPWVGEDYYKQTSKLLVVAESHYADWSPPPTFTIDLTRAYQNGLWKHRFWTQISQVITGEAHSQIDKQAFWKTLALYNFIQVIVGDSPGVAPTPEMIKAAHTPFSQVLDKLKPNYILVLSKRLWGSLPSDGQQGDPLRVGNDMRETLIFPYSGGEAVATWLPHPSYPFSAPKWHPWVNALLTQ